MSERERERESTCSQQKENRHRDRETERKTEIDEDRDRDRVTFRNPGETDYHLRVTERWEILRRKGWEERGM